MDTAIPRSEILKKFYAYAEAGIRHRRLNGADTVFFPEEICADANRTFLRRKLYRVSYEVYYDLRKPLLVPEKNLRDCSVCIYLEFLLLFLQRYVEYMYSPLQHPLKMKLRGCKIEFARFNF